MDPPVGLEEVTVNPTDLALYIHVPFCRQRCSYCHFAIKVLHPRSEPSQFHRQFLEGLATEAEFWSQQEKRPLTSLFLGGGTPSQLSLASLGAVLALVRRHFSLDPDCEISIEVNPEDIDQDYLVGLRALGFNRLSFGVQSFHDPSLRAIGRGHSGAAAIAAIASAPSFPKGLSFDLILGLPHQTRATLEVDLAQILRLDPDHVSLYMLERDLPTPLDKKAAQLPMPSEDDQAESYEHVRSTLQQAGYEHYEISNFAKSGKRCRHNLLYWTCGDYLAMGPAAVGRVGLRLRSNHEHFGAWRAALTEQGTGIAAEEHWSPERLHQERLIQGLRLSAGIPRAWLDARQLERLEACFAADLLLWREDRLCLSPRGQLLGNEVFQTFVEAST